MKKLFLVFAIFYLGLSSCSKIAEHNINTVQTTTRDIIISNNTIPLSAAIKTGLNFLQQKNTSTTVSLKDAITVVKNGKPYFHIVNANKGFVILSPDSAYVPVLAYDSANNFSFAGKDLNPGLKQWFNKHSIEIDFIRSTHNSYTDSIGKENKLLWDILGGAIKNGDKGKFKPLSAKNSSVVINTLDPVLISKKPVSYSTYASVGPLCATQWDQVYPFNQFCPQDNAMIGTNYGGRDPVGCIPTAMGQIMYYLRPLRTKYNFGVMALNGSATWNSPEMTETAHLLSDIGNTSGPMFMGTWNGVVFNGSFVSYSSKGSSADDTYAPWVFSQFGINSASRTETISDQILSGAKNGISYSGLLVNELLTHARPCMLSGYAGENSFFGVGIIYYPYFDQGHSWVCDGCQQTNTYYGYIYTYDGAENTYSTRTIHGISVVTIYDIEISYTLLHMNWGWGGSHENNNGWYNCNINYSQPDASTSDYQYFQTVIYNIHT